MTFSLRTALFAAVLTASLTAYAKPGPRHMHVVVFGDSLAFGAGDESGKGIAGRIEPELRSLGIDFVATTNLGATGATTSDISARLLDKETRATLSRANAIVFSAGANDFRRSVSGGERPPSPLVLIDQVLRSIDTAVAELHRINPEARILVLGLYIPLPHQRAASLLEPVIALWDAALAGQFVDNPLVTVVRMSDIVNGPERLSTIDSFHPGGEAYQAAARRIAEMLAPAALSPDSTRQPAQHLDAP